MKALNTVPSDGAYRGRAPMVAPSPVTLRRDALYDIARSPMPTWSGDFVGHVRCGYYTVDAECQTGRVTVSRSTVRPSVHHWSAVERTERADHERTMALAKQIHERWALVTGDIMAFDPKKVGSTFGAGTRSLSILVHGPTKVGKTRLAATCGDDSKVIILAAEHGLLSLRDRRIRQYEMDSAETLLGAIDWLESVGRAGKLDGWTVFLDSASDIAERILHTAKTTPVKGKLPDPRQAYGEVMDVMMDVMRRFRALPCTTVMIAQQDKIEQPDGSIVFGASLPGAKLANKAGYQFELVLAMHAKKIGESVERWVQTNADGRYEAGDRSGVLDEREPADLGHIVAKIRASVPQPADKAKVEAKAEAKPTNEAATAA